MRIIVISKTLKTRSLLVARKTVQTWLKTKKTLKRVKTFSSRVSWAKDDEAMEEEEGSGGLIGNYTRQSEDTSEINTTRETVLSHTQMEHLCFKGVRRQKDFFCSERVNSKRVNTFTSRVHFN